MSGQFWAGQMLTPNELSARYEEVERGMVSKGRRPLVVSKGLKPLALLALWTQLVY